MREDNPKTFHEAAHLIMEIATPDTSLSAEDRPIGGLGVHLVKNVSAHHCYSGDDGTNTIELYFQLAHDKN